MALRNEEIVRIKKELVMNVTGVGADVYITYVAILDRAVQPYLIDVSTTSSTPVVAASGGAPITIVLEDNPAVSPNGVQQLAFVEGTPVLVGAGSTQEESVIDAITGLAVTLNLANARSGTYTVRVKGAEQIVRDIFTRIDAIENEMTNTAPLTAGLAALTGEIEFFGGGHRSGGRNKFEELLVQRTVARRDLACALGVPYMGDMKATGGTTVELY